MKKRELILDFTSLLDVIMILLFVVISNMSLVSANANAAAKEEAEEAKQALTAEQLQGEEAAEEIAELTEKLKELEEIKQNNADLELELQVLLENHKALLEEYDYLKIITDFDASDTTAYAEVIRRMTKVLLLCETGTDEATGLPVVRVGIYRSGGTEEEKTYVDSVEFMHDFSLSKEERAKLTARQVTELTKALSGALRESEEKVVWCTVQYAYDDENFSQSDLEVIGESIRNLERSFSKTCFMEKIKIY